eukprot:6178617-Pleurochrysis_carterae.AAC.3
MTLSNGSPAVAIAAVPVFRRAIIVAQFAGPLATLAVPPVRAVRVAAESVAFAPTGLNACCGLHAARG